MTEDMSWVAAGIEAELGYSLSELVPAYVGDPLTKLTRFEGDKKGLYWIHGVQPDPDAAYSAISAMPYASKWLEYDAPVMVQKRVNGYVIFDFNPDEIWDFFGDDGRYENPQIPISVDQFAFGTIQPDSPSPTQAVIVKGTVYYLDDKGYSVPDQRTPSIVGSMDTSSVVIALPTTISVARAVMVQINPLTNLVSFKQSTYQSVLALPRALALGQLPSADPRHFCIGYIRLLKGMTAITMDHIWNAPELISKSTVSMDDIITSEGHVVVTSDGRVVVKGAVY